MGKRIAFVVGIACLTLPSMAFGVTRTWVSGVGDDVNPCSRAAPCKTFAGAISKTDIGGEINVLDPGGFGALTISKSMTIDGRGFTSSVLGSSTNGININIATGNANDTKRKVLLKNIQLNGAGTGLTGINVITNGAAKVRLRNVDVFDFTTGVKFQPASEGRLIVGKSLIADNIGNGLLVYAPTTGGAGKTNRVVVRNTEMYGNGGAGFRVVNAPGPNYWVASTLTRNLIADNYAGVQSEGAQSVVRISDNDIFGNDFGLRPLTGGQILSWGDNHVYGNGTNGDPTGMIDPV